jgi:hypothetical protein
MNDLSDPGGAAPGEAVGRKVSYRLVFYQVGDGIIGVRIYNAT